MMNSDHTKIEARQKEIDAEIARLQRERDDLDIAARVFKQLFGGLENGAPVKSKMGPPRPDGTPTAFEMTTLILSSAEKAGKDGLSAKEIVDEIRKRYWPGIVGAQILPSIYQFAQNGRIHKTAKGKFKLIRNKEEGPEA
jgi:hypothetical protein